MIPPNKNIFQTPEGYFNRLPEEILQKSRQRQRSARISYWSAAAAAVVVLGIALSIFWKGSLESEFDLEANLQPEIEMYINAGYWRTEWGTVSDPDESLEDMWF